MCWSVTGNSGRSKKKSGYALTECVVKFWPPSITARGVPAINAVRRPLAFAIYSRPFVAVTIGLMVLFGGSCWGAFKLLGRVW
jgi:hypothetical protein